MTNVGGTKVQFMSKYDLIFNFHVVSSGVHLYDLIFNFHVLSLVINFVCGFCFSVGSTMCGKF